MSKLQPVWHRMLYSCTHMATEGVKGLVLSLQQAPHFSGSMRVHQCDEVGSKRRLLCIAGLQQLSQWTSYVIRAWPMVTWGRCCSHGTEYINELVNHV